jgi:hypothetical protein
MKRIITKTSKHYTPCPCYGKDPDCKLCKGLGMYVSAVFTETMEETDESKLEEVIDAEEAQPLLPGIAK